MDNNIIYVDFNSKKKLITSNKYSFFKRLFYKITNLFKHSNSNSCSIYSFRKIL